MTSNAQRERERESQPASSAPTAAKVRATQGQVGGVAKASGGRNGGSSNLIIIRH